VEALAETYERWEVEAREDGEVQGDVDTWREI